LVSNINPHPNIVTISETWLTDENCKFYNMKGYKFKSLQRRNKRGGGVGVYISDTISYKIKKEYMQIMNNTCEYIVAELITSNPKSKNILLTSVYRPPNSDLTMFNLELQKFLNQITRNQNKIIILAGDLNIDLLKADSHADSNQFLNNLLSSGLVPTISKPTRITEHSSSLIDNIFISRIDQLIYSHIIYDDISDHLPILAQISTPGPNNRNARTQMLKRNFSAKNHNKYFELLKSTNWYEIGLSNEIDTAYNEFSDRLISIVNTAFPYESKTQNKKSLMKPWITQSIARCCRRKSRLQKSI